MCYFDWCNIFFGASFLICDLLVVILNQFAVIMSPLVVIRSIFKCCESVCHHFKSFTDCCEQNITDISHGWSGLLASNIQVKYNIKWQLSASLWCLWYTAPVELLIDHRSNCGFTGQCPVQWSRCVTVNGLTLKKSFKGGILKFNFKLCVSAA